MARILIVEDEPGIASFLESGFGADGHSTFVVDDGRAAAAIARDDAFDLVLLDLGLPELDGMSVLRQIRARGDTLPVIILTARDAVEATVAGFADGANDYVTKPFEFAELRARVTARLAESRRDDGLGETRLTTDDLVLDLTTRRLERGDESFELSAREFALAETLFRHAGQVLTREQLLSHVWGYDFDPGSNVVDVYVGYLRRKAGAEAIETVRGVGYRLRA